MMGMGRGILPTGFVGLYQPPTRNVLAGIDVYLSSFSASFFNC